MLTKEEAAAYSHIGINKLEELLKKPNCPFALYVGNKNLVKRREFEKFIAESVEIQKDFIEETLSLWYSYCAILGLLLGRSRRDGKRPKRKRFRHWNLSTEGRILFARYVNRFGKRKAKRFKKLQECRQWIAEATYIDEHSDLEQASEMTVDAWFEYWIEIKKQTVRYNTVRNYSEKYQANIQPSIGNKLLKEIKLLHCQRILSEMEEKGYKTSTIYQTRIALFNMLEFAKENDVQRKFLEHVKDSSYENQYRFVLQTGLRTGELIGLKWSDIDFKKRTLKVEWSMEYRYNINGMVRHSVSLQKRDSCKEQYL